VVEGGREAAGEAFEVGEDAVAALRLEPVHRRLKEPVPIHDHAVSPSMPNTAIGPILPPVGIDASQTLGL
jgi:hypothetical protein